MRRALPHYAIILIIAASSLTVRAAQRNSSIPMAYAKDFYPRSASTEPADADDDAAEPTDALSTAVADFLKTHNLAALDVYKDPGKRQQLIDFLHQRQIDRKQVDA